LGSGFQELFYDTGSRHYNIEVLKGCILVVLVREGERSQLAAVPEHEQDGLQPLVGLVVGDLGELGGRVGPEIRRSVNDLH
jgi:hypothetical protein